MSDSSTSYWKMIASILLFGLIGVYALYEWYDDRLQAQLAEKDVLIAESARQIKEMDARRLASDEGLNASRAEIAALKQRHEAEKRALAEQIKALEQAKNGLGQNLEGVKTAHAAELASEQRKLADVMAEKDGIAATLAETQASLAAEQGRSQALQADLDKVQQAIADSVAEHQAQIADLERHINERIHLARMTPEDAELLQTAREVGVLPSISDNDMKNQALTDELTAARSALESLRAEQAANQDRLAQMQSELEHLRAALAESQVAQTSLDATRTESSEAERAMLEDLRARLTTEQQVRSALQLQHEAAVAALRETLAETERKLATTLSDLESARTASAQSTSAATEQLTAANARIQSLEASLEEARSLSEQAQSSIREELARATNKLASFEAELQAARSSRDDSDQATRQQLAEATRPIETPETNPAEALQQETPEQKVQEQQSSDMPADEGALQADLAELKGTPTERGLRLRLAEAELRFPAGKATLPQGQLPSLDRMAALLSKHPELSVRVEGHTDSLGRNETNLVLSRQRAEAVRQALSERGVEPGRLTAEGMGAGRPIADNATIEGRGLNRRVELYILQ